MSAVKYWEVTCDGCGYAIQHIPHSLPRTPDEMKAWGILYKNGLHFCNKACYETYKERRSLLKKEAALRAVASVTSKVSTSKKE